MALTITCPICGKRNGYEFKFGGEEKGPRPEEKGLTPEAWCDYVHMNNCVAGIQEEWWCHKDGCGSWFKIKRDTRVNLEVEMTTDKDGDALSAKEEAAGPKEPKK